jgi:predicted O-methyltransferase YrrM
MDRTQRKFSCVDVRNTPVDEIRAAWKEKSLYRTHATWAAEFIRHHRIRTFAEIGVLHGRMTKTVLKIVGSELYSYWAIDYWKGSQRKYYHEAVKLMSFFPALRVVREDSVTASSFFYNGYFDAVFLDTSHHYESTKLELAAWLPKIRPGGWFCGHDYDYRSANGKKRYDGVKLALDEMFGTERVLLGDWWCWWFKV